MDDFDFPAYTLIPNEHKYTSTTNSIDKENISVDELMGEMAKISDVFRYSYYLVDMETLKSKVLNHPDDIELLFEEYKDIPKEELEKRFRIFEYDNFASFFERK